jgi:hypothetical protein
MSNSSSKRSIGFFSKINISGIIKDHLGTLKNYGSNSYSVSNILLFFVLPFVFSIVFVYVFDLSLNKDVIGILINVFSIFAGFLFNLLVLVYDVISKVVKATSTPLANQHKINLLEEIYFNISFEILLSLVNVLLLAFASLFQQKLISPILSIFVFWFVILFTLTLLMVLKRVHKLLSDEIEQQRQTLKP